MTSESTDVTYLEKTFSFHRINKDTINPWGIDLNSISEGNSVIAYSLNQDKINIYYKYDKKEISHIKQENFETVINNIHSHSYATANGQSFSLINVISHQALTSSKNLYFIAAKTILSLTDKIEPYPLCASFSNPAIKYYSSEYNFANDTRDINCSSKDLIAIYKTPVIGCQAAIHTQCVFYKPSSKLVAEHYVYDKVVPSKVSHYVLEKSHYNDGSIHYSFIVDSVVSNKLRYDLSALEHHTDLDSSVIELFNSFVNDTSSVTAETPKETKKNSSYLTSLIQE